MQYTERKKAFFKGMSSIFNIGSHTNIILPSDSEAILSDWSAVGKALLFSMEEFEKKQMYSFHGQESRKERTKQY